MPFTAFPIPTKVATKADVGLGNVDNTADANKPVSGPQQAALDGKANSVHTHAPADITSLVEFIQDTVAAFLVQGANVTLTYDDVANTLAIAASGGGGGGPLPDGNYGDVTVSGGGTVIAINSDVVTFAKMQEIATGTVIGRTTAGTGNPETITMAALKAALDVGIADVSGLSAALGNKLDAANPVSTGIAQHTGAFNLPTTAPGGAVLESDAGGREYSFSTSGAFTINATPPDGRVFGPVGVSNTDINPITRTLPAISGLTWINDETGLEITGLEIRGNGRIEFMVRRLGSQLRVIGLPVADSGGSGYSTPEEVRDALQTLTGANRLPASAIRDLPSSAAFALFTVTHNGDPEDGPVVGDTLTAVPASGWTGSGQWYRDNAAISGATALMYITEAAGVHDFRVVLGSANFRSNQLTVTAPPAGAITVIQSAKADGFSGSGATVTMPSGVGNSSKVVIALRTNTGKTITPPSGFTLDGTATDTGGFGGEVRYYSRSGFTGGPTSFAFTWSDGDTLWTATIVEATGLGAFSQVVGLVGSFGNSAGGHSVNVTTPAANSLVIAHVDLGASRTLTGTSPAVAVPGAAGFNGGVYGIYPGAGANTIAWTYDSDSQAFFSAAVYAPA